MISQSKRYSIGAKRKCVADIEPNPFERSNADAARSLQQWLLMFCSSDSDFHFSCSRVKRIMNHASHESHANIRTQSPT